MRTVKVQGQNLEVGYLLKGIGLIYMIRPVPNSELLKVHVRGTEPILLGKEQDIEVLLDR